MIKQDYMGINMRNIHLMRNSIYQNVMRNISLMISKHAVKMLCAPMLIYISVFFGCMKEKPLFPVPAWPNENSTILFEIKDTSKSDFIDQVDKSDCLTGDEKMDIKKWLFDHTHFRMAKWKLGKKVIISVDQYIPHPPAHNSKTGQSCVFRSGFMRVRIKEGERVTGYEYEYD